jgi:hypothetical protein
VSTSDVWASFRASPTASGRGPLAPTSKCKCRHQRLFNRAGPTFPPQGGRVRRWPLFCHKFAGRMTETDTRLQTIQDVQLPSVVLFKLRGLELLPGGTPTQWSCQPSLDTHATLPIRSSNELTKDFRLLRIWPWLPTGKFQQPLISVPTQVLEGVPIQIHAFEGLPSVSSAEVG